MAHDIVFKPSAVFDPERAYFSNCGPRETPPSPQDSSAAKLTQLKAAKAAATSSSAGGDVILPCMKAALQTLEVTVVDMEGKPLDDILIELRKSPTQALSARTDAAGTLRFQGLAPGTYQLGLLELDQDRWELIGSEPLSAERATCRGEASWTAPRPVAQSGPTAHVIQQGECLSTLAHQHGLHADTVWDLPDNRDLKLRRKNKNILMPGDTVILPPRRLALRDVAPANAYRIRRKDAAEELRIRFLDRQDRPRAGAPYLIAIDGPNGTEERTGKTDGDGFVRESVSASTTEVRVTLGQELEQETFVFRAAHLDPLDTLSGVQGRLTNLGYPCDKDEGKLGALTRRALRDFQRDEGLKMTGEPDASTRAAIEEKHLA
ncbi:peptidoglycan-binding protein [Myxococcus sp. AM001]|nr:peptidoglycan-binding protein [Myxococcus sp. AM001]